MGIMIEDNIHFFTRMSKIVVTYLLFADLDIETPYGGTNVAQLDLAPRCGLLQPVQSELPFDDTVTDFVVTPLLKENLD